jgi:hypothetical protein
VAARQHLAEPETLLSPADYLVARERNGTNLTLDDELPVTLGYGVPLVLRTARPDSARPEGVLRIVPA